MFKTLRVTILGGFVFLCSFLSHFELSAQNPISEEKANCFDSALYYCNEAIFLYDVKPDSAKQLAQKGLNLSRTCKFPAIEAYALNALGVSEYVQCNFEAAESYHRLAIDLMLDVETPTDTVELVSAYNGLANVFADVGALESSIDYYLKSLSIQENLNDSEEISLLYLNIGLVLYDQENLRAAKKSVRRSLKYIKDKNAPYLKGDVYSTLASLYLESGRLDSAEYFLQRSFSTLNNSDTNAFVGLTKAYYLITKARFENSIGQQTLADSLFKTAYSISKKMSDEYTLSVIDFYRADFAFKEGKLNKAKQFAQQSMVLAKESRLQMREVEAMLLLAEIYAKLGNYQKAWLLEKQALKRRKKMHAYDVEKKLLTQVINQQETEKANLLKQNILIAEKNDLQKEEIERSRQFILLSLFGIFLLLLLIFFVFRNIKQRNQLIYAKNRMISVLGHDIRTPINQVETIVQMAIEQDISKEDYKSMLQSVLSSVQSLRSTIDVIVTWSKGLIQKDDLKPDRIALKGIIEKSIEYNQKIIEEKNIQIDSNIGDVKIVCVSEHLELVFRNLINNAIKYSNRDGLVQIATHIQSKLVRIDVVDKGKGLSEDQVNAIMRQKSFSVKNINSGSGIGLILIQDFLEMNNASLEVHSQKGKGSIFSVLLPLA